MPSMAHIRKPWHRGFRTSSSGYIRRAQATPEPVTQCGAPVTDRDATEQDWRAYQRDGENVCPACIRLVAP